MALLAACPEAEKEKDVYSSLPLHLAAKSQASETVVGALLAAYPEAAKEKDTSRFTHTSRLQRVVPAQGRRAVR